MTCKIKYVEFNDIENELKKLANKKVIAGVAAPEDSPLAMYAGVNEFGKVIKPKNGKALVIPLHPAYKNRSPKDFGKGYFDFIPGNRGSDGKWESAKLVKDGEEVYLLTKKGVTIPERAFIRKAADNKKTYDKAQMFARQHLEMILNGQSCAEKLFSAVGESIASSIKSSITSNIAPPNSGLTRKLKGSNKTLIDSGRLLDSINYEVVE